MHTTIKVVLTGVCVVVLAWPLLFWGKPALPEEGAVQSERQLSSHFFQRHELLW